MASWTEEYFGPILITKNGPKPTKEVLNKKNRIGIYFSAHWCPPCRGFTPLLAEFFDQIAEEDEDKLMIVYVSSDQDQGSFEEYYGSMPWVAVPFNADEIKGKLAQKFEVRGIPSLFILDSADGSVKDADARSTVAGANGNTDKALAKWA